MNLRILAALVFVCLWAFVESVNKQKEECLKNPKKKGCTDVLKSSAAVGKKKSPSKPTVGKTTKPKSSKTKKASKPKGKTSKLKDGKTPKPKPKNGGKPTDKKNKVKPIKKPQIVKPKSKKPVTKPKVTKKCKRKGGCSKPKTVLPPSGKKTRITKTGCPKKRLLGNCRCKYDPKSKVKVTVFCQNMSNGTALARSLRAMAGYKIDTLSLRNIKVGIPPPLFRQMHISQITMNHCDLQELTDTSKRSLFSGLESSLNSLSFVGMKKMKVWDWSRLSGMYRLKSVNIMQSSIKSVTAELSRAARGHLSVLALTKMQMVDFKDNAFSGQHALTIVWIQGNDIKSLKRSMFPKPARKLYSFNLIENKKLTKLPDDIFTQMSAIRKVDLRNNRLSTLHQKMFSVIWKNLAEFKIAGNPLKCDCKLQWLIRTGKRPQINDLSKTTCASPARLKGRTLTSLKSSELKC